MRLLLRLSLFDRRAARITLFFLLMLLFRLVASIVQINTTLAILLLLLETAALTMKASSSLRSIVVAVETVSSTMLVDPVDTAS